MLKHLAFGLTDFARHVAGGASSSPPKAHNRQPVSIGKERGIRNNKSPHEPVCVCCFRTCIKNVWRVCERLFLPPREGHSLLLFERLFRPQRVFDSCFVVVRLFVSVLKGICEMQCLSARVPSRQARRGHVLWNPLRESSARFAPSHSRVPNASVSSHLFFHERAALTEYQLAGPCSNQWRWLVAATSLHAYFHVHARSPHGRTLPRR
jgi:hypothetical protein